ncbi:MAG: aldehyde dehydrogenase family protein [Chloroflexia bacterium]|nr:aldehyde dehydrogenase family protein [Chloroflexia bacterium]
MTTEYPLYIDGEFVQSGQPLTVTNPFDGTPAGSTWLASADDLERAIVAAQTAFRTFGTTPVFDRVDLLKQLAAKLKERRLDVIDLIVREAGKPVGEATVEVDRGVFTIETAAEEAKRIQGDVIPLDLLPSSKGRFGIVRRYPIGPIAGISPFNFPLNLALHKVAPAIASGNTIVLKPPTLAPLTMLLIAQLADEIGLPKGVLNVLPMDRSTGDKLVEDDRFKLLSFTGSPDVGWDMKRRAGVKPVVLELGGNAGVLVDDDADLDFAVSRIRMGAFAYAGQVCISVQRVFIHEAVFDTVRDQIVDASSKLRMGDPANPATELGPMIDDKAAARTESWIADAVREGATILTGGKAQGRFFEPTVIENANPRSFVCSREAFAPLVTLFPVESFGEGIVRLNDSEYGLQAGVFTNRLENALTAFERIEAGGVIINDVPTYRIDHMPYGGVKSSGLSREGIRYAIEDMTEPRLMVINRLDSQRLPE